MKGLHPKSKFHQSFIELLKEHLQNGNNFVSFAKIIEVNKTTLYYWLDRYPAFGEIKRTFFKKKHPKPGEDHLTVEERRTQRILEAIEKANY